MKYVGFSSPSVPIVKSNCKLEVVPEKIQAAWHQITLSEGMTTNEEEEGKADGRGGGGEGGALCPSPSFVLHGPFRTLTSKAIIHVSRSFVGASQGGI